MCCYNTEGFNEKLALKRINVNMYNVDVFFVFKHIPADAFANVLVDLSELGLEVL